MHMDQITNSLPGIIVIHSDICIYRKDTEKHNKQKPFATHENSITKRPSLQEQ